jgi:tyrosyl-tRNA synthetase
VRADVELGGTDQKFNLLLARDVQRAYGLSQQVVLTMPLLPGTDGARRMAKSLGNYVGVTDAPAEMYGKILSIPDQALATWYDLLVGTQPPDELAPRDSKRALARALVERFHRAAAAAAAEEAFDRVHVRRELPDDLPVVQWSAADARQIHLPALLAQAFGISTSDARRALAQGGVKVDGATVGNGSLDVDREEIDGKVLQLGKRRFARVRVESGR